jgi:hypothetical protein
MSTAEQPKNFQGLLNRMVESPDFATLVITNPETVREEYKLTDENINVLRSIDPEKFRAMLETVRDTDKLVKGGIAAGLAANLSKAAAVKGPYSKVEAEVSRPESPGGPSTPDIGGTRPRPGPRPGPEPG